MLEIDGAAALVQGRGVVVEQVLPVFVGHQAAVHHRKGAVDPGAAQVQGAGDLLLAGAHLPQDHHRLAGGRNGVDLLFQHPHGPADAVKAVHELLHGFRLVKKAQPVFGRAQGDLGQLAVEGVIRVPPGPQPVGGHPGELAPLAVEKPQRRRRRDVGDPGAQQLQQPGVRLFFGGIGQLAVLVQDDGVAAAGAGHPLQQLVLPAHLAEAVADLDRLGKSVVEAFDPGGDEEGVEAFLPGQGVGDHVADHHLVAPFPQPVQGAVGLVHAVDGDDVHIQPQQVAQGVGRLGDAGEPHDGVQVGIILGHFDGPQYVVDRQLDGHHRQVGHLPDAVGGAPAGDDDVVVFQLGRADDSCAGLQVAGVGVQLDVRKFFRDPLHGGLHPVVRGDAQDMCDPTFHL